MKEKVKAIDELIEMCDHAIARPAKGKRVSKTNNGPKRGEPESGIEKTPEDETDSEMIKELLKLHRERSE